MTPGNVDIITVKQEKSITVTVTVVYQTMNMEPQLSQPQPQPRHQKEQVEEDEEEEHPYMSLYEPLLLQAGPEEAEADACPSSSSLSSSLSLSSLQQHQQPEEVSSSYNATVTDHSHPLPSRSRPRINDATTDIDVDRARKRQKIELSDEKKDNYNNNNIAENDARAHAHAHARFQSVAVCHKKNDYMVHLKEQVAHILNIFLDGDDDDDEDYDDDGANGADGAADDVDVGFGLDLDINDSNGCISNPDSFNSIDNEKNSERTKLATKKKKQTINSKRQYEVTTTTPTLTPIRSIDEESNENCSDSGKNNATIRRISRKKNNAKWMEMYQRLVGYKQEHNDTRVPARYEKDPQLGDWIRTQRKAYKETSITKERMRLLNRIGFLWDVRGLGTSTARWMKMYQRLGAYKKERDDNDVPQSYKEDPELRTWVNNQRQACRNKLITEERKRLLNCIGFVWDGKAQQDCRYTTRWEERYERLVAYKKEHNDTRVPARYEKDPQFGRWVNSQRYACRKNSITEERKRLLNSIGFVWTYIATWEEMYERLVAYKKEHKDTGVPQSYKKDPKLGSWVYTQHTAYKRKKLTEERKRLLNSIGFVWDE